MRHKRDEDVPTDEIDRFHEERDKIYLDDYQASRRKKQVPKEFMPLSSGKIWSASESDEDDIGDYENDDDEDDDATGLSSVHRSLLKQEKLNQFKRSMGSDFEDSGDNDEDNEVEEVEKPEEVGEKEGKNRKRVDDEVGAWGGKKRMYYGGDDGPDDMNSDEEEMTLTECRRLRSQLSDASHTAHPLVVAAQPSLYDLVHAAGASRFPLIVTSEGRATTDSGGQEVPPITTREEEAEAYLRHSMPIYATPEPAIEACSDKMKGYLSAHYPDLFTHYQEYLKVTNWLDTVWHPLFTRYLETGRIRADSIAGQYIVQRRGRMEVEKEGLSLYYRMRQEQKSMFRYHPIHKALAELLEERKSCSKQDRAFLLLTGNVLLKNIDSGKSFQEIAKGIPGGREFLRCLSSPEEEKEFERLAKKAMKPSLEHVSDKSKKKGKPEEDNSDDDAVMLSDSDDDDQLRRPITYQMAKNKGFMVRRPKRDRNPRVKLRHKYKKALIRRKSQVPAARSEDKPYGGEVFGIRAGLVKSRKLK